MTTGGAVAELIEVKSTFLLGSGVLAGMSIAALWMRPKRGDAKSA